MCLAIPAHAEMHMAEMTVCFLPITSGMYIMYLHITYHHEALQIPEALE